MFRTKLQIQILLSPVSRFLCHGVQFSSMYAWNMDSTLKNHTNICAQFLAYSYSYLSLINIYQIFIIWCRKESLLNWELRSVFLILHRTTFLTISLMIDNRTWNTWKILEINGLWYLPYTVWSLETWDTIKYAGNSRFPVVILVNLAATN